MTGLTAPAARPCGSCPYRRDAPAGLWAEEEYARLPAYDNDTAQQPGQMFGCHQQDGRACAGWVGCHDMNESLALRFAILEGRVSPDTVDAIVDYVSPVPLFASGTEAAAHGRSGLDAPPPRTLRVGARLRRQGKVDTSP